MRYLTIALTKGRLAYQTLELLEKVGITCDEMKNKDTRKLIFTDEEHKLRFFLAKGPDVPTYVEYGAADIGIVGKDTIEEEKRDVFELLDLGFGKCHFSVAVPQTLAKELGSPFPLQRFNHKRVATKFVHVAQRFFASEGLQMELIKLNGNVELAATIGLADMIVDIVSTGTTLKENGLVEVREIFEASARLIANRVSYRVKNQEIYNLSQAMKACLKEWEK